LPPKHDDEIGRFANYRILRVLGEGGMGIVFLAEDVLLQRPVALKVMQPELVKDDKAVRRFVREARHTAALHHDHVVPIHQIAQFNGLPFLTMPYLEGSTLDDWLKQGVAPTVPQLLRVGRQVASGLAAAHEKGLVHRDVKPANIWLEAPKGRVKLLDFGLSRPIDSVASHSDLNSILGTPAYMALEVARGEPADERSDVYSLGCVMYRLATGRLPFVGNNPIEVLTSMAIDHPVDPCELRPDLPRAAGELILSMLSKDPAGRPATAREVKGRIARIERDVVGAAASTPETVPVVDEADQPTQDVAGHVTRPDIEPPPLPGPFRPASLPSMILAARPRRSLRFIVAAGLGLGAALIALLALVR
jgi:serine/threonine protein kinase